MKNFASFRFALCAIGFTCMASVLLAQQTTPPPKNLEYQAKDYSYLFGMPGFSDEQLQLHFLLYQGYVKNTNLLLARLKELELQDGDKTYDYGAFKRRLGWEWAGMRLHELYFENLGGGNPSEKSSPFFDDSAAYDQLNQALTGEFGSFEAWENHFIATGMIRGIGWSILYRDRQTGRIFNIWVNEHDLGHLSGGDPLLVMDVFEHAYITQYGLDRGKYISAFFDNINWKIVAERYVDSIFHDVIPSLPIMR